MELAGYLASILIGISLGLIGGGGSILTVPVLVYFFKIPPTLATAYSLFIVGITALVGGARSYAKGQVDLRTTLVFAIPSLAAVYLTRRYLVPAIPSTVFTLGSFTLTKEVGIMIFFGIIMTVASLKMIRDRTQDETHSGISVDYIRIILQGLSVGLLAGIVGAGGGFLIIPALVLFARLPMKKAVGTSLMIIAIQSLLGFTGDIGSGQTIDYLFLLLISAIAIVGIFVGIYLSKFVSGSKLKKGFGWFVLVMAVYIIVAELLY